MTSGASATPGPTIGLVVPYAGSLAYLREAVESVLRQTDPGWTLTVVEDGEQDPGARPWLEALEDPRVSYVRNERNLGVAGNFQRCLELAVNSHITFLGCDDRLLPDYVAVVRRALQEHDDVAIVQPGVQIIDSGGGPSAPLGDLVKRLIAPRGPQVLAGEGLLTSLMRGNWAYFPALCWRRETLVRQGFRQDLGVALDLEVLGRLVLSGESLLVLPGRQFEYRRHAASVSSAAAIRTDRFVEERLVMNELATGSAGLGWNRASRAARTRITSRLHAALLLPRAMSGRDRSTARALWCHLTGH